MTITEIELFKAVDLWATKECERQGMSTDSNVKRSILGESIVKEIRFPLMKKEEFATVVPDSEILTSLEVANMMNNFNSVSTPPVSFQGDKRVGRCQSCFRFGYVKDGLNMETKTCLNFLVDEEIMLYGIRLFGRENSNFKVTVMVKEISSGKVVVKKVGSFPSLIVHSRENSYHGVDIMFDPVKLKSKVKYNVRAFINGPWSSYGMNGSSTVRSHGVAFSFWNCKINLSSGFHECGQVGDIFFKLP